MISKSLARKLLQKAIKVRKSAYAPYSKFHVGAAVLDDRGRVFTGVNVENASYGLTICAERTAIFKAATEGARRIRAIAVVAAPAGKLPQRGENPVGPCGACRQVIREFGPDAEVILVSKNGIESASIRTLLPHSFGPEDL